MDEKNFLLGKIQKNTFLSSIPKSKTIVISILISILLIAAIFLIVILIIWTQSNVSISLFFV
jgi:hypothetical protein